MNNQHLPPYHAEKIDGIWCVLNSTGTVDVACDCRHDAEMMAADLTDHALRAQGLRTVYILSAKYHHYTKG